MVTRYARPGVAITETTPAATKSPRWGWLVWPALAIGIGGGLGRWVATREPAPEPNAETAQAAPPSQPLPAVKPVADVAVPAPATTTDPPAAADTAPDPAIELSSEPGKPTANAVRRATVVPKHKPKTIRRTPCNVYDHMDGC